jgi:hypothetical protein
MRPGNTHPQAACLQPFGDNVKRGADRACRFQNHQVAALDVRRDALGGLLNVLKIRLVPILEWRRHRDDEDIGRLREQRCGEISGLDRRLQQDVEIWLLDVRLALVDRVDDLLVDVHTHHFVALGAEQ